jgi:hypothetical protein
VTEQERDVLTRFLKRLTDAQSVQKDADADAQIRRAVAQQPDAAYLLVQRTLLLEQALNKAQTRIGELQREAQSRRDSEATTVHASPWEGARAPSVLESFGAEGTYRTANSAMPARSANATNAANAPGSGPSFLGTAAAAAVGTVAGSFLFQGIEGLLHNKDGWLANNADSPLADGTISGIGEGTTTVNNYYDVETSSASDPFQSDYAVDTSPDDGVGGDFLDDSDATWL